VKPPLFFSSHSLLNKRVRAENCDCLVSTFVGVWLWTAICLALGAALAETSCYCLPSAQQTISICARYSWAWNASPSILSCPETWPVWQGLLSCVPSKPLQICRTLDCAAAWPFRLRAAAADLWLTFAWARRPYV